MYTFNQQAEIKYSQNVQRYEIPHMNDVFVGLKNSNIDSEINFYKEFTTPIGRNHFYVKGFLTCSRYHELDVPGKTTLNQFPDSNYTCFPSKCCYFSFDENYDYYLQGWTNENSTITLDDPDLIRIRYGEMRILPGKFIHGGGFKNT